MAIPHSGTKAARVERLLDVADLRTILAPYTLPEQITPIFTRRTLSVLARRAGLWNGGTKWGLANALLGWRDQCRQRGAEFQAEITQAARAKLAGRPRQERLL